MNFPLHRMEFLLRQWLEGWSGSSAEDFLLHFLQELERILPQVLASQSSDLLEEMNVLLIVGISPQVRAHFQEKSPVLNDLLHLLQQVAREQGMRVHFSIEFVEDPRLKLGEVWVDWEMPEQGSSTRAMPNPLGVSLRETGKRAYLIVPGGNLFPLEQSVVNVGRMKDNHLVLDDPRVSRHHAQIRRSPEGFILFDLNSTGGTMVNHLPVHQWTLRPGDVISLAGVTLVYGEEEEQNSFDEDTTDTATLPKGNA
ncbi:FHA domain-containing protein [Anaerolinea thermophila]|uniref:FHA domain-containing protein n=1 Tax=Anaerolinea thermophila (strain DSM 14523 / JCM 11388 / NBRC 100420 / UNI-1) TaxID=926569 RepID=E8N407_ANATU|nr:FHA domain-containing protein [Anaerolinea thermophila]BAJ63171.1 hypothetical protein ANT_11370 [Anaerolinea thermophila UNI-1]